MAARAEHSHSDELLRYRLSLRLGAVHARQRLSIENEFEMAARSRKRLISILKSLSSTPGFIRTCLLMSGLLGRGQRNSRSLRTLHNSFYIPRLPAVFDGFRILHLTDLHVDMDPLNLEAVIRQIQPLSYDLCVLTGDYRCHTWGCTEEALKGMAHLKAALKGEAWAVLGNHDSVRMVPALEDMGYNLLLNEQRAIERQGQRLFVAGVDDAHHYKAHNLHRAAEGIPEEDVSILLSHTPEIWREAAHAGFDLFLCGHTHGGQICLPGSIPITLDSPCPRRLGRGYWRYNGMQGYTSPGTGTSLVNVRLNCPPEVTVHTLHRAPVLVPAAEDRRFIQ